MKKYFTLLGLLVLGMFSFAYSEKSILTAREYDQIMIKIKEEASNYERESENATIIDNTITPGICGRKVNINKSYTQMKQYGKFNQNLFVFDYIKPKISLSDNKDKAITQGNAKNNNMSIILIFDNNIDTILEILKTHNTQVNFFLMKKNKDDVLKIIKDKHTIGFYEYYDTEIDLLARSNNININYCYYISDCKDKYLIKSNIIKNNYLINTKKVLQNGSILIYKESPTLTKELPLIIDYIKSKGINIVSLDELIKE